MDNQVFTESHISNMNSFALRLSVFYGFVFLIVGIMLPFFPLWLKWKELQEFEISVILAAPLFVRLIFTPTISFLADRSGNHRLVVILLCWGTLLTISTMFVLNGFTPILLVSILFSLFWMTVMPLTETIAMTGVRREGLDYGRMRLWGSLTFILISIAGGYIIKLYGPAAIPWMFVVVTSMVVVVAYWLPREQKSETTDARQVSVRDIFTLAFNPVFLIFLIGASLIQATHSLYYSFGSVHWESQGISTDLVGILWAIGVIAETVLFAFSARVIQVCGGIWLLLIAGIAGVFRWTVMAFDPGVELLFGLQVLHALTFGAGHLGAIYLVGMMMPERYSATAQGLYAALSSGFVMGIGILSTGPLYEAFKGQAYLVMSVLGALSVICIIIVSRWWDGQVLEDPADQEEHPVTV